MTEANARPALLSLLWLASPALPVGGFSYSEGLEAAVEAGMADSEAGVRDWLVDQLQLGLASSELPVVAETIEAARRGDTARVLALDAWVRATRESAEFALQAQQMGRSIADWLSQRAPAEATLALLDALHRAPTWPVGWALAAASGDASLDDALAAYAFAWSENAVQAAVKAVPLGQSAGQRVLQALVAAVPAAVAQARAVAARGDDARQAFLPGLAVQSARHETQYSRLFRS
ncbi:urease accessory protein UreF [Caldimonas sp. KR1-144]|uniref:urease accessory protein UreF n=1 Tax=Caldimonas sp. KR1-144 TaxID=3400911 RepID=UPI003C04E8F1